jgi:hypothetical protein
MPRVRRSRSPIVLGSAVVVLVFAAFCFTAPGAHALGACHRFLDFYAGVFSLVSLSLTVMGGLAATDRLILLVRHRVLLQAIHRATAAAAMGFLGLHILMKIVSGHAGMLDAVVPFLADHRAGYVGLGTVGAYLMVVAAWTGVSRGRFAGFSRPALWRVLHASAYAAWPVSLLHGLASGRTAPGWVIVSYSVCLIGVALALAVRLNVHWGRKRAAAGTATTGSLPRIGAQRVPVPPSAAPVSPGPPLSSPVVARGTGEFAFVDAPAGRPDYTARHTGPPPPRKPAEPRDRGERPDRRRTADTAPPPARTFESVSDAEFWAFMRGERR